MNYILLNVLVLLENGKVLVLHENSTVLVLPENGTVLYSSRVSSTIILASLSQNTLINLFKVH